MDDDPSTLAVGGGERRPGTFAGSETAGVGELSYNPPSTVTPAHFSKALTINASPHSFTEREYQVSEMGDDATIVPYGNARTATDVGHVIRAKRESLGATQAATAALVGVGTRFLSDLERGKATCELGKVLQVLARLGIDVTLTPRGGGQS